MGWARTSLSPPLQADRLCWSGWDGGEQASGWGGVKMSVLSRAPGRVSIPQRVHTKFRSCRPFSVLCQGQAGLSWVLRRAAGFLIRPLCSSESSAAARSITCLNQTRDQHQALWCALGRQLAGTTAGGRWTHGVSWDLPAQPQHTCGVCSVGAVSAITLRSCSCSAQQKHGQWMPGGNSPSWRSLEEKG